MPRKKSPTDARLNAARYRAEGAVRSGADSRAEEDAAVSPTMEQRAQFVQIAIDQAIRRGDFDDLPGAGKPLTNLRQAYDPDWWIRQKIASEKITGLGPAALTLRTENSGLDARLAAATSEKEIREILNDFNARVIAARRQLEGGPPVVTPTRDIDGEIDAWQRRRATERQEHDESARRKAAEHAALSWGERRRERRRARRRAQGEP